MIFNLSEIRLGHVSVDEQTLNRLKKYFPEIIPTDFEVGFEKTLYWFKKNLIKGGN